MNSIIYNLFLLAIFFQLIPNVNIFGTNHLFFTTNFFSLSIIILLGIYLFSKPNSNSKLKPRYEILLVLIFLATQAISFINALNIQAFILIFISLSAGVLIFFISKLILNEDEKNVYDVKLQRLNTVVIFACIVNIIFQSLLLVYPDLIIPFIRQYLSFNLSEVIFLHFSKNKLYTNFSVELILPLLFVFIINHKGLKLKLFSFFLLIIIFTLSFLSNFRYRILGYFFAFFSSIFLYWNSVKNIHKHIFIYGIFSIIVVSIISSIFNSKTVINRFTDIEEYQKYSTIQFRLHMYTIAFELGSSNLFGVGLGNMYDYLQKKTLNEISNNPTNYALTGGAHNIFFQTFAETGLIGLLSLVILIIFWLLKDIRTLNIATGRNKVYIPMFWTLIVISQFISSYNTTFYIFFFLLRGLI